MVKVQMSTQNRMVAVMNRCTMVKKMRMMRTSILILVGMATVMMLQRPMNPMGLVSKRMGKIENIFFFVKLQIFLQISRFYRHVFSCLTSNKFKYKKPA